MHSHRPEGLTSAPTLAVTSTAVLVLFLAVLGRAPLARETSQLVTDLLQLGLCTAAAAASVRAAVRAHLLSRVFWALVSSFVVLWTTGQLFWTLDAQGLASAGMLAPSDLLFLASSAPLLLALVVRPDRPREGALGFVFDLGLVVVFAFHAYLYFSLGYLVDGEAERYHEWVNALGNLDSAVVLLGFLWVCRTGSTSWRPTYQALALVMVMLHGGSALSSYTLLVDAYHPGLYDLPWTAPFLWLALIGWRWRPAGEREIPLPPDYRDTRRGLVLAMAVIVGVPTLHLSMEVATSPSQALSTLRHLLTLFSTVFFGALFLARQLALSRRAEAVHLEREKNLERLFHSNPLPQFLCRRNDLGILEVNRAAEDGYGFTREQFFSKSFVDLHPPGEAAALRWAIDAASAPGGTGRITGDWHARTERGESIVLELTARELDVGAEPTVLVVASDVTQERSLESRLRDSQKMEALGRLAGGVAHDFNNLLTAILGYCSLLETKLEGAAGASSAAFVREIARSGERAAALTRQLLAFSRKQVLVPQVVDLREVVRGMALMMETLIGEDVELVMKLPQSEAPVEADPGQLEQVVLNLAVNARDAMPDGGRLTIQIREEDGTIALAVSDTGTGMDAATLSRVFEPFFTTKPAGKGTGLGLATVYGIVTQSGGSVAIDTDPGRGTRCVVRLPRAADETLPAPCSTRKQECLAGSATVLLVEDEEVVRSLGESILEAQGYRVLSAPSGDDAIEIARRHDVHIDIVVTDVVMPGMKGPELVTELLELQPSLRVLYVSGYAAENLGLGGMLDASTPFLAKPFTAAMLARSVRDALRQLEGVPPRREGAVSG